MRERLALGVLGITQQGRSGSLGCAQILCVETCQADDTELLAQLAGAERGIELPGRAVGDGASCARQRGGHMVAIDQHLGRTQPRQPRAQLTLAALGQAEFATGQRQPGQAEALALLGDGQQQCVALVGQQLGVGHRAGGDDAHHLALDRALGGGDIADLFAQRHRLTELDELGEVTLDRMHRHAGHHHRLAGTVAARGECDVEQAIGLACIVEEQLVEVAHPVEHQRVGELGLDAQVLLHHRCVGGEGAVVEQGGHVGPVPDQSDASALRMRTAAFFFGVSAAGASVAAKAASGVSGASAASAAWPGSSFLMTCVNGVSICTS